MITFDFNGESQLVTSTDHMSRLLSQYNKTPEFELWATSSNGPSLCMLRNGGHAWLMYLRQAGDSGFSSRSGTDCETTVEYRLANGQCDEYPLAWCIDVRQCYEAFAFFFENAGARPESILWKED